MKNTKNENKNMKKFVKLIIRIVRKDESRCNKKNVRKIRTAIQDKINIRITLETAIIKRSKVLSFLNLMEITLKYIKKSVSNTYKNEWVRVFENVKKKGIGRNKLTTKMIDKLTVYYGFAIRKNYYCVEKMRNVIWATFEHYSSMQEKQSAMSRRHRFLVRIATSKSQRQFAKLRASFSNLPSDVLNAIRPIYKDLSNKKYCKGTSEGLTQTKV